MTRNPAAPADAPAPSSDWRSRAKPVAEPGTPLAQALESQSGDVVTVDTPTGPAQFTRAGERFYSPEESAQMMDAGGARLKERALQAGLSFLSGGGPLVDEMAGVAKALDPVRLGAQAREALSGGTSPSLLDTYRQERDTARRDVAQATRDSSPTLKAFGREVPVLPLVGAALPSVVAPNPLTAGGRILSSGAQGAVAAAGNTEADLTRGQVGDFAGDVALGGGVGLGAGVVAEGMTAPLRWFAGKASSEGAAAGEAARAQIQAAKDKAAASATGTWRQLGTQANAQMRHIQGVLQNPAEYDAATVAAVDALKGTPEYAAAANEAAMSAVQNLPDVVSKREAAKAVMEAAQRAARPDAVARVLAEKQAELGGDVATKAWKSIGQRALLGAAGSALGSGVAWATGMDPKVGAGIGATAGFMPQGALQFMRNQGNNPLVQQAVNEAGAGAMRAGAAALTKAGTAFSPMAQQRDEDAIQAFLSGGM